MGRIDGEGNTGCEMKTNSVHSGSVTTVSVNYNDLARHIITLGLSFEDIDEMGLQWINGVNDDTLSFGYYKALKDGGGDLDRECDILELYLRDVFRAYRKVHEL